VKPEPAVVKQDFRLQNSDKTLFISMFKKKKMCIKGSYCLSDRGGFRYILRVGLGDGFMGVKREHFNNY
jgi:hypothetical protein